MKGLRGLIVDGVTGTGKSSTLAALAECASRPAWLARACVVTEEETLGEALSQEMQNAALDDRARAWRLDAVLDRMDREGAETSWILERFHPTYAALLPAWTGVDEIDQRIAAHHFVFVLLRVPEQDLMARALRRADRGEAWTAEMAAHYGSEQAALNAIVESQRRREAFVARTRLPTLVIDTSSRDWAAHATAIARFCALASP